MRAHHWFRQVWLAERRELVAQRLFGHALVAGQFGQGSPLQQREGKLRFARGQPEDRPQRITPYAQVVDAVDHHDGHPALQGAMIRAGQAAAGQRRKWRQGQHLGCAPGLNCAEAGVFGEVGPIFRLRLIAGAELDADTVLLGGVGLAAARVSSSRAYVTAGSAFGESSSFNRSSSPFEVDDLALGVTIGTGVEQQLSDRLSFRAEALYDRFRAETASTVELLTMQTSGPTTSRAEFAQTGDFDFDMISVRLSLLWRF